MSSGESRGSRAGRYALAVAKLALAIAVLPMLFGVLSMDGVRFANALITVVFVVPIFALIGAIIGFLVPPNGDGVHTTAASSGSDDVAGRVGDAPSGSVFEGERAEIAAPPPTIGLGQDHLGRPWAGLSPDATVVLVVIVLCAVGLVGIWLFAAEPTSGARSIDYQYRPAPGGALSSPPITNYQSPHASTNGRSSPSSGTSDSPGEFVGAEPGVPKFTDYSVPELYSGSSASVVLAGDFDREFRTRILATSSQPVNFAGEYSLSLWGCGADCLMGVAVSKRTGKVVWLPGTICCWRGEGERVMYRADSSLIVLAGIVGEDSFHGAHFFSLIGSEFVHLQSVPVTYQAED